MVAMKEEEVVGRVGQFEFRIVCGEETPESREQWERRGEAIAAWLLARWREQHGEGRN
jgi:hypothetical protein